MHKPAAKLSPHCHLPMRKALILTASASLTFLLIICVFLVEVLPRPPAHEAETWQEKVQRRKSTNQQPSPTVAPAVPSLISKVPSNSSRFSNFAVALKTGGETVLERVPMQLLTFLSQVENLILIGDTTVKVGGREVLDVYTDVYAKTLRKLGIVDVSESETFKRNFDGNEDTKKKLKVKGQGQRVVSGQDVNGNGWKADAHKNLPGLQVLAEKYPDADWYLMIDDDTYVVFDNLVSYLETKDPNEPHFIGRNNYFKGCDGVTEFHTGPGAGTAEHPYIAQGGSGIVISRGAMTKMQQGLNQCIIKYKDCWAGDIRTALCLRDNGVIVSWGHHFYQNPPLDEIIFPDDPCSRPNTFHHVLPSQMQKLYELEQISKTAKSQAGKALTMGRIFTAFHSSESFVNPNTDRPGGDLMLVTDMTSSDKCQALCEETTKCVAWTFESKGGKCRLKNGPREVKTGKDGFTSGIVGGRYVCGKA